MGLRTFTRLPRRLVALMLAGAFLLPMGGCPVNGDQVLTEVVRAALETATSSLVDTLSSYLATN